MSDIIVMAACWAAHYTTNQPTPPPFCPCHIRPPLPAQPHQCLLPPPSSSSLSSPLRTVAPPCIWKGYEISVGGSWVQGHSNTMYTEVVGLPPSPTPSVLLPLSFLSSQWKCNFPITPLVRLSVDWSVIIS